MTEEKNNKTIIQLHLRLVYIALGFSEVLAALEREVPYCKYFKSNRQGEKVMPVVTAAD